MQKLVHLGFVATVSLGIGLIAMAVEPLVSRPLANARLVSLVGGGGETCVIIPTQTACTGPAGVTLQGCFVGQNPTASYMCQSSAANQQCKNNPDPLVCTRCRPNSTTPTVGCGNAVLTTWAGNCMSVVQYPGLSDAGACTGTAPQCENY